MLATVTPATVKDDANELQRDSPCSPFQQREQCGDCGKTGGNRRDKRERTDGKRTIEAAPRRPESPD